MTQEESAEFGATAARRFREPLTAMMAIPGIDRTAFWGGFLSALAGYCHNDLGREANTVMQIAALALASVTSDKGAH